MKVYANLSSPGFLPLQDLHSVVLHRVGVPIAAKTAQRVHMEVTDDGGWHAGAEVRIVGLVKTPQHNGKVGVVESYDGATERYTIKLSDGTKLALRLACLLQMLQVKLAGMDGEHAARNGHAGTIFDYEPESAASGRGGISGASGSVTVQ